MRLGWKAVLQTGAAGDKRQGMFARFPFSFVGLGAIILALMLAKWTWILFAPRELSVIATVNQNPSIAADNLFGVTSSSNADEKSFIALRNVQLAGVFAGSPGFAILELNGKRQVGVPAGGEIVPGVKLVEIAADHVVIEGGGIRQRIDLKWGGVTGNTAAATAAAAGKLSAEQRENDRRQLMGGAPH
jgi:Type II secretion system protein C